MYQTTKQPALEHSLGNKSKPNTYARWTFPCHVLCTF